MYMWLDLQKPTMFALKSKYIDLNLHSWGTYHTMFSLAKIDKSAFIDESFVTLLSHIWVNGTNRGHQYDGKDLKLIPCINGCLFDSM